MLNFFYKSKCARGAVSIFLVIVLLPMITISSLLIDYGRVKLSRGMVEAAGDLTLNTGLTSYDQALKELYGIFAVSQNETDLYKNLENYFKKSLISAGGLDTENSDKISEKLMDLIRNSDNTDVFSKTFDDMLNIGVSNFNAKGVKNSSIANSGILKRQIVEFMKYRAPIDTGLGFLESLGALQGLTEKKKAIDAETKFIKKQSDIYDECKNLYNALRDFKSCNIDVSKIKSAFDEVGNIYYTVTYLEIDYKFENTIIFSFKNENNVKAIFENTGLLNGVELTSTEKIGTAISTAANVQSKIDAYNKTAKALQKKIMGAVLFPDRKAAITNYNKYAPYAKDAYIEYIKYVNKQNKDNATIDSGITVSINSIFQEAMEAEQKVGITLLKNASNYISGEQSLTGNIASINQEIKKAYDKIKPIYDQFDKAKKAIDNAVNYIEKIANNVDQLNDLASTWQTSIEGLPGDDFRQNSQLSHNKNSQSIKKSEVDELQTILKTTQSWVKSIQSEIDKATFCDKKIYEINDRTKYTFKEIPNGTKISEPPIDLTGMKMFIDSMFNLNYKNTMNIPTSYTYDGKPILRIEPNNGVFHQFIIDNFNGTREADDSNKNELKTMKDNSNGVATDMQKNSDSTNAGTAASSISMLQFVSRGFTGFTSSLNSTSLLNSGITFDKWLPSKTSIIEEGKSATVNTYDSDSNKIGSGSTDTITDNTDFISTITTGISNFLKDSRDNLYVADYLTGMFSYDTVYRQVAVKDYISKNNNKFPSGYATVTNDLFNKTVTLTRNPINAANNFALGNELEYILFGQNSSTANVAAAYGTISVLRLTLNLINGFCLSSVRNDALNFSKMFGVWAPVAFIAFYAVVTIAETGVDMVYLRQGKSVPIFKTDDKQWVISSTTIKDKVIELGTEAIKMGANALIDVTSLGLREFLDMTDEQLSKLSSEQKDKLKLMFTNNIDIIIGQSRDTIISLAIAECQDAITKNQGTSIAQIKSNFKIKADEAIALISDASKPTYNASSVEIQRTTRDYLLSGDYIDQIYNNLSTSGNILDDVFISIINTLKTSLNDKIESACATVKKAKDKIKDNMDVAITKGAEGLKGLVNDSFGAVGSGDNAVKKGIGAMTSFYYSDYLKLFACVFLMTESGTNSIMLRTADVMQYNLTYTVPSDATDSSSYGKKSVTVKSPDKYQLSKAYTYINITADITVPPLFMNIPFINEITKDKQTSDTWNKFKYKGLAGY